MWFKCDSPKIMAEWYDTQDDIEIKLAKGLGGSMPEDVAYKAQIEYTEEVKNEVHSNKVGDVQDSKMHTMVPRLDQGTTGAFKPFATPKLMP